MVRLIAGIEMRNGGAAEAGLVERMLAAMNPLGRPAAQAVVAEGAVGFGVVEIAPPGGRAPIRPRILADEAGLLAADARLYEPAAEGDAALAAIRAAIGRAGREAAAALHGDFAWAFWERASGALELVRDHFGVRPLYYTHRRGEYLAFASLPAALLATGLAARLLDEEALRHFHLSAQPPRGRSFYAGLLAVPAAHALRFAPGLLGEPRRYWRLALPPRLSFESDPDELAAELRRRLERAVRRRLPARGPGAGEFSGGLDSTPIGVLAARALREEGRPFYAYSLLEDRDAAELPIIDEGEAVEETAAREPNLHLVRVPSRGLYAEVTGGWDPDSFLPRAGASPLDALLADAAGRGAETMFSGWGGDQVVTSDGTGAFAELFWCLRWRRLAREIARRCRVRGGTPRGRFVWMVLLPSIPLRLRAPLLRLLGKEDDFSRALSQDAPYLPGARSGRLPPDDLAYGPDTRANRRVAIEGAIVETRCALHAEEAAPHGIAYAFPMLDLDLVDFAMQIPGIFFARPGEERSLIRDAIRDLVPDSVRLRPEKLMPYPLESWRFARDRAALLAWLREAGRSPLVRRFVDVDALTRDIAALPDEAAIRAEVVEEARHGRQPPYHEGELENPLRLVAILAEHEERLSLRREGDAGE